MQGEINPLADIAAILGKIAKALPPLPPPPPFPTSQSPKVESPQVKPLGARSDNYGDVNDGLLQASTEKHRAEQRARGLVPFYYE